MSAAPSQDWSVFKQIFAEHWDAFQHAHPRYQTASSHGLVTKLRGCGNPAKMGDSAYRCLHGGQGKPLVAMRCQSSLCLRCAKVYGDTWVHQVSKVLHAGVIYRHILLTVPAMFRTTFDQNTAVVWRAVMRCGVPCLDEVFRAVRGKALRGGYSTVRHTHGRHGPSHPHLPLLAPSGGEEAQGDRWEHLQSLPYALRRRKWPWYLWRMVRHTLKTEAVHQVVETCCRTYPNGLVTNVQQGAVPSQYQRLARYVAQDVVSPPIAVRRIEGDDGERVTDHERSHRPDRMERDTVNVDTCIGRMVHHTVPKGCKRLRYSGVQATKTFAKVKVMIQAALAKVEGVVRGAVQVIARLTYRQRYAQSPGRDPFRCPHGQSEMEVWCIWHPTSGVI